MNKEMQAKINNAVVAMVEAFNEKAGLAMMTKRLRSCSAQVIEYADYYALKSYRTIVAIIDKKSGICYDFLRYAYGYTSTSSQHIAKFKRDYGAIESVVYR